MTEIIRKEIIQIPLLEEVRKARLFLIMVDEVTSHNVEQMPVCVRFVDNEMNIREEFLQFHSLSRTTGEYIARKLKEVLEALNLDFNNLRGQGYDGAANMSSERIGLQAQIKKDAPLAVYTHCASHRLNLVVVHPCALPSVRNIIDKLKAVSVFFLESPKHMLHSLHALWRLRLKTVEKECRSLKCVALAGLSVTQHTCISTHPTSTS